MRSTYRRVVLVALLAAAAVAPAGCANDQETINRVQPYGLEKKHLDGEWYYLQTVVDTPVGTSYTFVGDQSDLRKIKWEVEENFLTARRAYDLIAGGEAKGPDSVNDAKHTILARYRILSHFDIRREYNPTTGEQTNVIAENSVDRPWHKRAYMRVDWSQNLVTDGDFMTIKQALDGIEVESASYLQEGVNAPLFDTDQEGRVNYVDVVNKLLVKPTTVNIPDYGEIPTCFLNGHELELCQSAEVSVRNSFRKVEDHDYQPALYTGDRMERFGFFINERKGFSKDYGVIEGERYRFAQRHNLWQRSHRLDSAGNTISCTADEQCKDGRGSVCDKDYGLAHRRFQPGSGQPLGLCTVAYRDREIRPVVYYMSPDHPAALAADAQSIATSWNKAFVETVSSLRENECLANRGTNCAGERTRADHQKIFHVCTTPVQAGAPKECGPEGLAPRPGDLRYHQIVWVGSEETGGPLGYGPGHSDPTTGETIMGNAFMYGAGVEKYAGYGRDLVRLLNGDLAVEDLQSGDYISGWAQVARARENSGSSADQSLPAESHVIEMTPASLEQHLKSMDLDRVGVDAVRTVPRTLPELQKALELARGQLYKAGAFGQGVDQANARLNRLVGTDLEAMMVTPDMRLAAGLDPSDTHLSEELMNRVSPLRGMSPNTQRAIERARQMIREHAGYYDADFHDEGLVGLALELKALVGKAKGMVSWYGKDYVVTDEKGRLNYELVRRMILHPMYHGLVLHEVGHSIGLRHNFSGSYDAANYSAKYWDLRDDGNMAPRFWDPTTEAERAGRIREYQYSTVMDYGNNFVVSDAAGIGHYDMAAIKMGYGDLVEVFSAVPEKTRNKVANVAFIQSVGWPILLDVEDTRRAYNYTNWPEIVGGRANLQRRVDVPYTELVEDPRLNAKLLDSKGRPVVPFLFCSDEQADLNPDCMRYDAGADAYESVQSIIDSYWYYYPFINFRRQRIGFDVGGTVDRIHGRYFEKVKRAHQIFALYQPILQDIFNIGPKDPFWGSPNGFGAWTLAAGAGFELLKQVVSTPEPGSYVAGVRPDGQELLEQGEPAPFTAAAGNINTLEGRFLETTWDFDAGYFWFDQLDRVGYFYDKVFALITLVDPTTYFINRDTAADIRRYQINYTATYPDAVSQLFRAVLAEDWSAIAPRFVSGRLVYPGIEQMVKRTMDGTPISPNISFSVQLYAAIFGMAYIPQTYDQGFVRSARVWVDGGAEAVTVDPSRPTVSFTDPDSGLTYRANSFPEDGRETGVGASMLAYAETLRQKALGADAAPGTPDDKATARTAMRRFVDNVDIVRRLTWQLGFGAQP